MLKKWAYRTQQSKTGIKQKTLGLDWVITDILKWKLKNLKNYGETGEDLLPGIELEETFKKGARHGGGRVDVVDHRNKMILDYKFGNATMSPEQYDKYCTAQNTVVMQYT